jgi:hypothetical protein
LRGLRQRLGHNDTVWRGSDDSAGGDDSEHNDSGGDDAKHGAHNSERRMHDTVDYNNHAVRRRPDHASSLPARHDVRARHYDGHDA